MRAFVLGWPVEHSKSPAILNAAFAALGIEARMEPRAVPPDELAREIIGLRALPMLGASVTVPHKLAIAALCDELRGAARDLGAVNCLALEHGRLVGHNTDVAGFLDGLGRAVRGARAVLLGKGGAARAVEHALRSAGADVELCARPWPDLHAAFARADLLVDCTSAGLDPAADAAFTAQLPVAALPAAAWVGTLVYHRRTALLDAAAPRVTFDGRAMLVHQAAHALALWTGREPPLAVMTRALDDALANVKSA
ncbi:MAG TPA: shikimate dehydrogenase [Kofleriaceae bacterium]|jgi:shikimate dehydrogenase